MAVDNDIQLYAVGIGDVPEEVTLAAMVKSSGGAYYSAPDLDSLQAQVKRLTDDLLGQYVASYISLRERGKNSVRVEVTAQESSAAFEAHSLNFGSFYGRDIRGVLAFDPPVIDVELEEATLYVRALHVPRNITGFRVRHLTGAPIGISLVPKGDGGLLEEWEVSGPDELGFYDVSSATPLEFGSFGVLLKLVVPWATVDTTDPLLEFDNSIYQADKSFLYPSLSQRRSIAIARIARQCNGGRHRRNG